MSHLGWGERIVDIVKKKKQTFCVLLKPFGRTINVRMTKEELYY